jgi:4-amino-4-deoxy-L-arabinose transferase-like glycosyltransferase
MTTTAVASPPELRLRPVLVIAAGLVGLQLALAARYGYHRDELYFLTCARHLAWGYVDQPPFVPFVARLSVALFGSSVVGLRLFPALFGGVTVVFTALTARELGGSGRAQTLAALAAATSVQVVATDHLLSTASFDLLFWSATILLVVRLLRTGDNRMWLAIGAVAGVGMLNKYNIGFLLAAVVAGLLIDRKGRLVFNLWALGGAALAVAVWSPNLLWNAGHHWASFAMLQSLRRENSTLGASIGFIPAQLLIVGPVLIPLWLGGLVRLLGHTFARSIGVAYLALVIVFTLSGAKPYYLGGAYFPLFAAGGIWADERLVRGASHLWRLVAWVALGEAAVIAFALPVRPVGDLAQGSWEGKIDKDLSATVGWNRVVAQIAAVADRLPPPERLRLVVFTGDYGAAGAVDHFGAHYGLPRAISGHNNYWWWGPGDAADGSTTIAVDLDRSYLETVFGEVVPAGTVDTGHGVWTEERGDPIWICRQQKVSWARAWPGARHYD